MITYCIGTFNQQIFTKCFGLYVIIPKYLLLFPTGRLCVCAPVVSGKLLSHPRESQQRVTWNLQAGAVRANVRLATCSPTPVDNDEEEEDDDDDDWRCS